MPKIDTYPVVTPTADDLLIGTNGADGVTKNFTAGSVSDLSVTAHAALTTTAHGGIVASTDPRLTDARTPLTHAHPESDVTSLATDLAAKAPLASPALTGVPTAPTAAPGTNTTQVATTAFSAAAIAALVASSPATLDTLNELAAALGNDANFATTVTNALAGKQPLDSDLTAIAALATTAYGRAFLALADAAAARTATGAATEFVRGRLKFGGNTYLSLPGVTITTLSTFNPGADFLWYFPFDVATTITVDLIACEVTTLAGSGLVRLGIYNCNSDLVPAGLIVDSGALDTSTLGVKSASISNVLSPGRYLLALLCNNNTNVFRSATGTYLNVGISPTLGASLLNYYLRVAQVYGVLPPTGGAITQAGVSSILMQYPAFLRISVP